MEKKRMPELPEVETIRRDLEECLQGAEFRELRIADPSVLRERQVDPATIAGRSLRAVRRRGKYLVLDVGATQLVIHLRMTGRILPAGHAALPVGAEAVRRRQQFRFRLATDRGEWIFFDTRRFGTLDLVQDADAWFDERGLAPDPLLDQAAARQWFLVHAAGGRAIKTVLLDQQVACGVGNIYADEALFRTRLHPETAADVLDYAQRGALFSAAVQVMKEAIARRGTTTSDYLDLNGNPGVFRRYLNVYRRAGLNCRVCGQPIQRIVVSGRGTHYCPTCQAM
ncbi:MAG: bifunctional DNA-formamidopyrimidine glycosylase/DNA-(apurinic or apyrimidinic site) lyase [Candidatus Dadabacteria bacterium]|nr:MAG: bifunctional DNA-formamidopyrimidine glycosylase/DNA-(apurinic or apyrimidinic site) lyase [Candidatus Dadabacteria bacterium]